MREGGSGCRHRDTMQEPRRQVPWLVPEVVQDPSKIIRVLVARMMMKLADPEWCNLPPLPCFITVEFLGEGLDSTRASHKKVQMSRDLDDAPAIWDLAALGNHAGDIPRGGLEVCEHLSIERGNQASWLVEGQFAHRRHFHRGRTR